MIIKGQCSDYNELSRQNWSGHSFTIYFKGDYIMTQAKVKTFGIIEVSKDLDKVAPIGTILTVKVQEKNKWDGKALRAYLGDENIGFVAKNQENIQSIDGSDDLYDLMDKAGKLESGYEVVVVRTEKVMLGANGKSERVALIVEPAESDVSNEPTGSGGELQFDLKVKGQTRANPTKTALLKVLTEQKNAGVKVEEAITLVYDAESTEIHVIYNEKRAGVVEPTSDNYDEALKVLSVMKQVPAVAGKVGNGIYMANFNLDEETMNFIRTGKRPMTLTEVKEEKSAFIPIERLNRIQKYMEKSGLSSKMIMKVMQSYKKYDEDIQSRIPEPSVIFSDSDALVKRSVVYLNHGKHLRLIGEKGTGKNLLTTMLAWIYQRPLYELSMNAHTDKLDLLGGKTFEPDVKDGKEVTRMGFAKEALVEAMEVGGFMNLDEVNTADPAVLVLLHSIVDDRGTIEVPSYGRVVADDNFGMILTMNVDYVGTNSLNEATRDRFTPILFPNNASISKLLKARVPSAKTTDVQLADKIYKDMMKMVKDGRLDMDCITVRGFIDALEVIDDLGVVIAMNDNITNRVEDEDYRKVVKSIVDAIVG